MSQIKLIALDLDGTLLNSRGEITEANLAAIRAAENVGVLVTIATGRRFRDARPVAAKADLNAAIITHNGALIKDAATLKVVNAAILPDAAAGAVLRLGREFGVDAMLSADPNGKGTLYYDRISDDNVQLQKYIAWSTRIHGDEAGDAIRHVESLQKIVGEVEVVHIAFSGSCERMRNLNDLLERALDGQVRTLATVYESQNFSLLDILHPRASKGYGVQTFAELNNLTAENVMAIGDNFNDLDMLEYAGTPVVMGNSAPQLIERFQSVLSNDESGVALAIEQFVLGEQ